MILTSSLEPGLQSKMMPAQLIWGENFLLIPHTSRS